MADTIQAAVNHISDKQQRTQWISERWQEMLGREYYFGRKNAITTDAAAPLLAKLAGKPMRPETDLLQSLLDQVAGRLKVAVEAERDPKACGQLAAQISRCAEQIKDAAQRGLWSASLSKIIAGKEEYRPKNAKKDSKALRDPCADAIVKLLAPPPAAK